MHKVACHAHDFFHEAAQYRDLSIRWTVRQVAKLGKIDQPENTYVPGDVLGHLSEPR